MHVDRSSPPPRPDTGARIPDVIPVFPLPNVVLFPGAYVPLHIFELRYRDMVMDAVAGSRHIGMALLKEGWEDQYYRNPPIYEIGCVGRMVHVTPLADGRFDILLQGVARCEIREQLSDRLYRKARVALKRAPASDPLSAPWRDELYRKLADHLHRVDEEAFWRELLRLDVPDDTLVNNLSMLLDLTPLERQFLLEAETIGQRARRLSDLIEFKRYERHDARGWG